MKLPSLAAQPARSPRSSKTLSLTVDGGCLLDQLCPGRDGDENVQMRLSGDSCGHPGGLTGSIQDYFS